jgi:hypothetical protein
MGVIELRPETSSCTQTPLTSARTAVSHCKCPVTLPLAWPSAIPARCSAQAILLVAMRIHSACIQRLRHCDSTRVAAAVLHAYGVCDTVTRPVLQQLLRVHSACIRRLRHCDSTLVAAAVACCMLLQSSVSALTRMHAHTRTRARAGVGH